MPISTYAPRLLTAMAVAATTAAASLHGCSNTSSTIEANIAPCTALDTLVADHSNQFSDIRKHPRPYNSITVWQTDYEVIKDRCEIWGWGQNKFNYICSAVSPNKEIASTQYKESIKRISQCLNSDWVATESPRKVGNGVRTLFTKGDSQTAVSVHMVETPALFNSEWTTYASVGNFSTDI